MLDYPTTLPIDAASVIVAMVRDGSYKTKQRTFGQAVINVGFYGAGIALVDQAAPTPIGCSLDDAKALKDAHAALCDCKAQLVGVHSLPVAGFDFSKLLALVTTAISILEALLPLL